MSAIFQHGYGFRARSNWGEGEHIAPWTVGDVVYIPADCKAFREKRVDEGGLNVIISAFSISEGPGWYFRVSPLLITRPRYSYIARVEREWVSDRLHVYQPGCLNIDGTPIEPCDYTEGFVLVHEAVAP